MSYLGMKQFDFMAIIKIQELDKQDRKGCQNANKAQSKLALYIP